MAELVDALVSNTNGAIRAGSIPAPGTQFKNQVVHTATWFFNFCAFCCLATPLFFVNS